MRSIRELSSLSGRVALVTGATGTVGPVFCDTLAELGATVVICDMEQAKCQTLADKLAEKYSVSTFAIAGDLEDNTFVSNLPNIVNNKYGELSIIVYAAAYTGMTAINGWVEALENQTVEAFEKSLRVNLTSAFSLVKEAFPLLKASSSSSVIFLSSIYGIVAPDLRLYDNTKMENPAGYNAAKGGILQLSRYFSTVLAPHVRVNAISPGGVRAYQPDVFHEKYKSKTPLGRMAKEEDLKGAIAYLASDMSAYVTGHNLVVDGGWVSW